MRKPLECQQCGEPTPLPVEIVVLDPETKQPHLYVICSRTCARALRAAILERTAGLPAG